MFSESFEVVCELIGTWVTIFGVKVLLELSQELGLMTLGGLGLKVANLRSEEPQKTEPRNLCSRCSSPAMGLGTSELSRGGLGALCLV